MLTIEHLTRVEKLRMMEALWDDLSREDSSLQSPAWHGDALHEAEAALAAGEARFIDWDQAKKLLLGGDTA
ncbi:hypothetical protein PG1C_06780 [Rugosibacter aromaticivorans]|uniref:Acyl-protein synthetase n=1 Tax=Rugosibacter aromaticivorans TaxID=1565605 RepID=A0A0C5IZL9_9PROT|nr:addiction module protein [Rugosibacter aromaticivorans]AJP48242.1 hypothetical protein PG1C_06780 [Rugosibacter aromaticivorans]TBR14479.1 MAG: acyl-protein synthetase [Rugosibacter sp.]